MGRLLATALIVVAAGRHPGRQRDRAGQARGQGGPGAGRSSPRRSRTTAPGGSGAPSRAPAPSTAARGRRPMKHLRFRPDTVTVRAGRHRQASSTTTTSPTRSSRTSARAAASIPRSTPRRSRPAARSASSPAAPGTHRLRLHPAPDGDAGPDPRREARHVACGARPAGGALHGRRPLVDKPAGPTSHDIVAAARRAVREATGERKAAARRPRRHARPVRHRPAARARRPRHPGAALPHGRCPRPTRWSRASARSRRPATRRGDHRDGRGAGRRPGAADGRAAPGAAGLLAVKVDGRRAYELARAGEEVELSGARHRRRRVRRAVARRGPSGLPHRLLLGHLRPQPGHGPRRRLLRGAAAHGDRPVRGRRRRRAGGPRAHCSALDDALAFLPRVLLAGEDARAAAHGRAVAGAAEGLVVLADADGPIAVAEPREDGLLKPVVGFRG